MTRYITVVGILIAVELVMAGLMKLSAIHQIRMLRELHPDVDPSQLDPAERDRLQEDISSRHEQTPMRMVDIVVIAYHIPVVAILSGMSEDRCRPYVFMPVTLLTYIGVAFGVLKLIGQQ